MTELFKNNIIMARLLWYFVIVSISIQQIFAIDCSSVIFDNVKNCDECIRCGGLWCNKPSQKGDPHCVASRADNWCPDHVEILPTIDMLTVPGMDIHPKHKQATLNVAVSDSETFTYDLIHSKPQVTAVIINSTQKENSIEINKKTRCTSPECTTTLKLKVATDFCSSTSGTHEFFHVKVHVENVTEEATMKYHVPCACECSKNVEKGSKMCNSNGDYSCGVCKCSDGWTGDFCNEKLQVNYECDRGDLQCTHPLKSEVECSGNGKCGKCDCICFTDTEGSQYFDKQNYCADICMTVNECDICLEDRPLGECPHCHYPLFTQAYNESRMSERDSEGRKIFVKCEETLGDGCRVEYAAARNENNDVIVMRLNSCMSVTDRVIAGGGVSLTLPIVLGVIAVIAAAVAVAGYVMWKNRDAPIPPASAQYQELDGPKTRIEENPTYKSPTTSYNNPMWKQKV